MKVDDKLISKLEKLSKLRLSEEERKIISKDLEGMITMIDKLSELDTEGIEPLIYVNQEKPAWRKDEVADELSKKEALVNAPRQKDGYFVVPKVVKKD